MMKFSHLFKITVLAAVAGLLGASSSFAAVSLTGSGSTFATPIIDTCKVAWQSSTGNTITYSGGGSGTGRTNADKGLNDFNFSDATYMPAKSSIVHIPLIAAPIGVMVHLNSKKPLYLSPQTIADIFAGKITKWNDTAIAADNNGTTNVVTFKKDMQGNVVKDASGKPIVLKTVPVKRYYSLPNQPIQVIFRADSSGTTQNFVNFLIAKAPSTWTKASNSTFSTAFPGDITAPANLGRFLNAAGSAGVTALAAKTNYSITYAESSYAASNGLQNVLVKNDAGNYQPPDSGGTATFLSSATIAADGKVTFNYTTKDAGAYLLGIVTYGLVDTAIKGASADAVKSFFNYILSPACPSTNSALNYTTLQGSFLGSVKTLIAKIGA